MEYRWTTGFICVAAGGVVATALIASQMTHGASTQAPRAAPHAVDSATCTGPGTTAAHEAGNPKARRAAQLGLTFLAHEAEAWQTEHQCYGCHVHAVTLEAFAVGRHNQYELAQSDLTSIVNGMLDVRGGARRPVGFAYQENSLLAPAKAFGGAAFARYDQWIGGDLRDDLVKAGEQLLTYQQPDGSIRLDWVNPPVGSGTVQGVYQAAQTWRQVFARTADSFWLPPLQKAEAYLQKVAHDALTAPPDNIQDLDYTMMGLAASGVGSGDEVVQKLAKLVLSRQRPDGGWGFQKQDASVPFATGQALYALRAIGMTDQDPALARGIDWLISHQAQDGGWSHAGFGKAEAMWGVLGLVSVDVLSVAAIGVQDGDHVADHQTIGLMARDNDPAGGGVVKVELQIDDVRVASSCGASLAFAWDTTSADAGKHVIDLIATNARGQTSRRRLEVYAGAVYMTQIGWRSSERGTEISLRDIAPRELAGKVELQILSADKSVQLASLGKPGEPGAMNLVWDGTLAAGKPAPTGRYIARLVFANEHGVVQTEDIPFVRGTEVEQRAQYGEVQGQLALPEGAPAANTSVDLVDDKGAVMQTTKTTADGQYRFKGVDAGKYKLRVAKKGFGSVEAPISAAKAHESKQDLKLK
jgi:hypothetical protein